MKYKKKYSKRKNCTNIDTFNGLKEGRGDNGKERTTEEKTIDTNIDTQTESHTRIYHRPCILQHTHTHTHTHIPSSTYTSMTSLKIEVQHDNIIFVIFTSAGGM